MTNFFENLAARAWNRLQGNADPVGPKEGLFVGAAIRDGAQTRHSIVIPEGLMDQHLLVLGRTGQGKTTLLKHFMLQDIKRGRHSLVPDRHHDLYPFLLQAFAAEEVRRQRDMSEQLVPIDLADTGFSVGLNPLEAAGEQQRFGQIAEFEQLLSARFDLRQLGVRTSELLLHLLFVVSANSATLLEIRPLLTDQTFLARYLEAVDNAEVRAYFDERFSQLSEAMRRVVADAVLNKISGFALDARFRHLLGQTRSTFSLLDCLDSGRSVGLDVDKGKTGEPGAITAGLLLTAFKHRLFSRQSRAHYRLYGDELPTLLSLDSGVESLFSEARKFGVCVLAVGQHLEQFSPAMRSALLSVSTYVCFGLAGPDAHAMAALFGGGKQLEELLKNLPPRQFIAKIGHHPWVHGVVPELPKLSADPTDLYERCRSRWARPRAEIERDIQSRHQGASRKERLDDWE